MLIDIVINIINQLLTELFVWDTFGTPVLLMAEAASEHSQCWWSQYNSVMLTGCLSYQSWVAAISSVSMPAGSTYN